MKNRKEICPAHLNLINGGSQPLWDECYLLFTTCPHYENKAKCWSKWDKQPKRKEENESENS